jgi:hypothetical protein
VWLAQNVAVIRFISFFSLSLGLERAYRSLAHLFTPAKLRLAVDGLINSSRNSKDMYKSRYTIRNPRNSSTRFSPKPICRQPPPDYQPTLPNRRTTQNLHRRKVLRRNYLRRKSLRRRSRTRRRRLLQRYPDRRLLRSRRCTGPQAPSTSRCGCHVIPDATRSLLKPTTLRQIVDVVHFEWSGDIGAVNYCP